MKIGIIGAGAIGLAFAKQVANAGYEVIISNSRGADSLATTAKILGRKVQAGSVQEAVNADVIFLAVPWKNLGDVTSAVPSWKNKIVIDPTNPIIMPGFQIAELHGKTSTEVVAGMMPGANVVKAFNTLAPPILASSPIVGTGRRVIIFSGNDAESKGVVSSIITTLGFAGIDLGRLDQGGKLQQFPGGPLPTLDLIKQ